MCIYFLNNKYSAAGWGFWCGMMIGLLLPIVVQAQNRFLISANGAEVRDERTGLRWQRCSAGQRWDGVTCTGAAATYTHENALSYAKSQTGWRLPTVKELASLTDKTRKNPSIDIIAFPSTSSEAYWTSSPLVAYSGNAWYVHFGSGYVHYYQRDYSFYLRLVR